MKKNSIMMLEKKSRLRFAPKTRSGTRSERRWPSPTKRSSTLMDLMVIITNFTISFYGTWSSSSLSPRRWTQMRTRLYLKRVFQRFLRFMFIFNWRSIMTLIWIVKQWIKIAWVAALLPSHQHYQTHLGTLVMESIN